ncbi:hypothetical protein [Acetonema longum]|uniref:Uncharacterized protein n=1 Tax=Acetonema longum DSM 6540 TaxID=1009370 RepID=F7NJP8_9FIRM|nr:hypothetical protein [Acetonema longum]EGO63704.1 hypothetical protein ALO_11529 [Acetonema longum DSM 6540]
MNFNIFLLLIDKNILKFIISKKTAARRIIRVEAAGTQIPAVQGTKPFFEFVRISIAQRHDFDCKTVTVHLEGVDLRQ